MTPQWTDHGYRDSETCPVTGHAHCPECDDEQDAFTPEQTIRADALRVASAITSVASVPIEPDQLIRLARWITYGEPSAQPAQRVPARYYPGDE